MNCSKHNSFCKEGQALGMKWDLCRARWLKVKLWSPQHWKA